MATTIVFASRRLVLNTKMSIFLIFAGFGLGHVVIERWKFIIINAVEKTHVVLEAQK